MPYVRRVSALAYTFTPLFVFATGCAFDELKHTKLSAHRTEVHWGYEGERGPESWGRLCPDFTLCSEGMNQSPIDISEGTTKNLPDIVFNYQPTTLNILNNGHTIQANYDKGSSFVVDGTKYELKQFHFHVPSEHTLSGKHFDMEMHLVHQSDSNGLAVVGVLIENGSYNRAFSPVLDNLPTNSGEELHLYHLTLNANELLPGERFSYRYDGSLTTPPCTEDVKWFVLVPPVELSESQIALFDAIIENNNRPVQPLNSREVVMKQLTSVVSAE